MSKALFKESDFLLGAKVMRFLAERFTESEKVTIGRSEIEKAIKEKLTSKKVGLLTQALKGFGIKTTSEMVSSHEEKLTFVIGKPNIKKLSESWQAVQRKKTATLIIVA